MSPLSRLLVRILVAGLGYGFAIVASLLVGTLAVGALGAGDRTLDGDPAGIVAFVVGLMRGSLLLGPLAGVVWPAWAAAVALAEVTGIRSLLVHLLVAAAIAVVGVMGTAPLVGIGQVQAVAAMGLVAGFAHWLVAGRSAGLARPRPVEGAPRGTHDGTPRSGIGEDDPTR